MFNKKIEVTISIDGMKCEGCTKRVENVLSNIKEVEKYDVSLEKKQAIVILKKNIEDNILKNKIENLGFNVLDIKKLSR